MVLISGKSLRIGPEANMVKRFLDFNFKNPNNKFEYSIFIEPQIGLTKPDIVIVCWDYCKTTKWPHNRLNLTKLELKLAHLLFNSGPRTYEELTKFFPKNLKKSLESLHEANLIMYSEKKFYLNKIENIFATLKIIAIEAKIASLSRAIQQAHYNTWFCSESYVLTTIQDPTDRITKIVSEKGIGLWSLSETSQVICHNPSKKFQIPNSFISWYFNELAWQQYNGYKHEY